MSTEVEATPTARTAALPAWHRLIQGLLALHVLALAALAVLRDVPTASMLLLVLPLVLAITCGSLGHARVRPLQAAIGLAWCTGLLVLWSGGAVEAWLHGALVLLIAARYRDRPSLGAAAAVLALIAVAVGAAPELLHDPGGSTGRLLLLWGVVAAVTFAAAAAVVMSAWTDSRAAEDATAQEVARRAQDEGQARRQQELAAVYATVARRSQGLLERQLQVIERLEADEKNPATLEQLFVLDHLTTRMTREAASMLVLAGGDPNRRVSGTPPLSEVVRGAVGEIEDYTRVHVALDDDRDVEGVVVAALVHLLSELMENAAHFSPPDSQVAVVGATTADGGFRIRVVDRGIGLDDSRLHEYNHLLANPPAIAPVDDQRLGLGVVARLAGRHALPVQLSHNDDGIGITAAVQIPSNLLDAASDDALASADEVAPMAVPTPARVVEPVAAAPAVRDAAPTRPVPDAAPVPAARPRWASATAQAGSSGGSTPAPASAPAVADPPAPARATSAPSRATTAAHAAARSASSWSYAGHLQQRPDPHGDNEAEARRRRFGRGTRTQVSGVAPRAEPAPASTPPPTEPEPAPADKRPRPTAADLLTPEVNQPTPEAPRRSAGSAASAPAPSAGQTSASWGPAAEGTGSPGPPASTTPTTADLLQEIREAAASAANQLSDAPPAHTRTSPHAAAPDPAPARDPQPAPATTASPEDRQGSPPAGEVGGQAPSTPRPVQDRVRMTAGTELPQRRRGESLPPR